MPLKSVRIYLFTSAMSLLKFALERSVTSSGHEGTPAWTKAKPLSSRRSHWKIYRPAEAWIHHSCVELAIFIGKDSVHLNNPWNDFFTPPLGLSHYFALIYLFLCLPHYTCYSDVIMGLMASQITSLPIVYSTVYSATDQGKYQSSTSLAFARGIHRQPVKSPHKWTVTRKIFSFDDVIM